MLVRYSDIYALNKTNKLKDNANHPICQDIPKVKVTERAYCKEVARPKCHTARYDKSLFINIARFVGEHVPESFFISTVDSVLVNQCNVWSLFAL